MNKFNKVFLMPVLSLGIVASSLPAATSAFAAPLPKPAGFESQSNITEVRHRRGHHRHHRRGGWGSGGAVLGGIVAGALIAGAVSESRARGSDRYDFERCRDEFRSFNPRTGTYITYQGEERLCPYLR